MKSFSTLLSLAVIAATLSACGSEKTTVIREPAPVPHTAPVVIHQPAAGLAPSDVESMCKHGYDNRTRSCY